MCWCDEWQLRSLGSSLLSLTQNSQCTASNSLVWEQQQGGARVEPEAAIRGGRRLHAAAHL